MQPISVFTEIEKTPIYLKGVTWEARPAMNRVQNSRRRRGADVSVMISWEEYNKYMARDSEVLFGDVAILIATQNIGQVGLDVDFISQF